MISNRENFENKVKIKEKKRKEKKNSSRKQNWPFKIISLEVMHNLFSYQKPFKKIHPLVLEIYQLAQETFSTLLSKKNTKNGEGLPCNDR